MLHLILAWFVGVLTVVLGIVALMVVACGPGFLWWYWFFREDDEGVTDAKPSDCIALTVVVYVAATGVYFVCAQATHLGNWVLGKI